MDVLVLGSGGREHVLAWRLARDDGVRRVRIAPGNAGTPAVAETVEDLDPLDPVAVARHASRERYDLVVIGPEAPLAAGVADALAQAGIPAFGPTREAARLESSKAFAKQQMLRAGVPTAEALAFTAADDAVAHLGRSDRPPVVKADWLAAGKGVVVADTADEAEAAVRSLFDAAPAAGTLLLEERLSGWEVSAFALVSGETVTPLGAARDYKRLADGEVGPNTGGMGAHAPVAGFGPRELDAAVASVFEPIAWRMARDGIPYRGVLYAGLMVTERGPMVLEFNARFGDPEAQVLLPMLDGDLGAALLGVATGDRSAVEGTVAQRAGAAVGVVLASEGYPAQPLIGRLLTGADPAGTDDAGPVLVFHAGTRAATSEVETTGGRVLTVVGLGEDLQEARRRAYGAIGGIGLEGGVFRTDIAAAER